MEKMYSAVKGAAISVFGGCLLAMNPLGFCEEIAQIQEVSLEKTLPGVDVIHGKCSMKFPSNAERVSEKMQVEGAGFALQYDAYIASSEANSVFMLLVAEYPDFVDEQFARMSLEAFLNGILTHNPANQLLFADLVLVQGYEGLDFFIRSGAVYFKGRAVMVRNQLYLMAMECEVQNYDESNYNNFVDSFVLTHS